MMDIVERLQSDAEDIALLKTEETDRVRQKYKVYGTMVEASDEIERLREERDKYRKALQEIAAASKIVAKGYEMETALKVMIASYRETALKALGEKSDHPA